MSTTSLPSRRTSNRVLWTLQGLLAALYVFTGVMKLVMPAAAMQAPGPVQLPVLFLRFIGLCELLGAIGLILPSLLRIRPALTPIAAICLAIIMIGATTVTLLGGMGAVAAMPFLAGVLDAYVAYGRSRLVPIHAKVSMPRASQS